MSNCGSQFSHRHNTGHAAEILLYLTQLLVASPLLGHVDTRTNVSSKRPIRIESWHSDVENPSKFAVVPPEAILHPECLSAIKGLNVRTQASLQILGIDPPLRPAVAKLLFERSAGEIQPRLVEVGAKLVNPRHPDHDRSTIGHQPKACLTLA